MQKPVPNTEPILRLVDPRLKAEFKQIVGHDQLVVASLPTVIEALSKNSGGVLADLASAIQIEVPESPLDSVEAAPPIGSGSATPEADVPPGAEDEVAVTEVAAVPAEEPEAPPAAELDIAHPPAEPEVVAIPAPPGPLNRYFQEAYQDQAYEADDAQPINKVIQALRSHNWYTQNPAIAEIRNLRSVTASPTAWFVLGRNIYQAACGNAHLALEFISTLGLNLSRIEVPDAAQDVLAGMVYEVYFDSLGEFRLTPKGYQIEKPFQLLLHDDFADAADFIRVALNPYIEKLRYRPWENQIVELVTESTASTAPDAPEHARVLTSMRLDGDELLVHSDADDVDIWIRGRTRPFLIEEVVNEISRSAAIPRIAIARNFEPVVSSLTRFSVPAQHYLQDQVPYRS